MFEEYGGFNAGRRGFLAAAGVACGALGLNAGAAAEANGEPAEEAVSPNEDLMREHAVLSRMLLIYRESAQRLETGAQIEPAHIHNTAILVQRFIGEYHEVHEEESVFPRFKQAGLMTDLVDVLVAQHNAGRRVTSEIIGLTSGDTVEDPERVVVLLRSYERMYKPHSAHEDTVLFPEFPKLMPAAEYAALGEKFEEEEHERFGEGGFEVILGRVVEIEKALGIHDLGQFTPPVPA